MMNYDILLEFYYAVARMGLGLGGVAYDLDIPRTRCASRSEGIDELD